ncbi:3,4-dihydroxy-2-butanone-4-phosphate synthase [Amycolatopsis thermoflava]|uniref:3,4-dihydroxy-2-butanone-4-phosphate synthase n=1 Tax=Amycolatopsis TaxID=1813 RepID=UPI0033B38F9D
MTPTSTSERLRRASAQVAAGRPVVLVGDDGEGNLVFAASLATAALVGFTVRHTSGFVRVALTGDACERLDLPPIYRRGDRAMRVTVDHVETGTGISGADRARTIAALAAPESVAEDFSRPGHVVPVRAADSGVAGKRGTAEAALDLARLAGLPPAAAFCEIVSVDRPLHLSCGDEPAFFAAEHGLALVATADLAARCGEVRRSA